MCGTNAWASSVEFLNATDINDFPINKPYKNIMDHSFKFLWHVLVSNKIIGISQ